MKDNTRERLVLPILIPLLSLGVIFLVAFGFSRVLLSVPRQVATAVALGMALNVIVVGSLFAGRRRWSEIQLLFLVSVAAIPVILGGAVAVGIVQVSGGIRETKPSAQVLKIEAKNINFGAGNLEGLPDAPISISFTNNDSGIPHNIAIFNGTDASAPNVFRGQLVNGPATVTYSVPALKAGAYFFHCDVHPTMQGTLTLKPPSSGGVASSPASSPPVRTPQQTQAKLVAKNISFAPTSFNFAAGSPIRLQFDNQDSSIPHNFALFKGKSATGAPVFRGDRVTGPNTVTYQIPALATGDYFFRCDVHPNMTGTLKAG